MNFEDDFMACTYESFSKMRLMLEGAIALLEDEVCSVYQLLRDSGEPSAVRAFDDIGTALYTLRQDVLSCRRYTKQRISRQVFKKLRNCNEKSTKEPPLARPCPRYVRWAGGAPTIKNIDSTLEKQTTAWLDTRSAFLHRGESRVSAG